MGWPLVSLQHLKALGKRYCKALCTDAVVVAQMHAWRGGGLSYRGIADALNRAGVPPLSGQQWYPSVVRRPCAPPGTPRIPL
jgi:hypothetical protein